VSGDKPKVTESTVPEEQYPQLGLCPFCCGYGKPYLAQIDEDWGEEDPDDNETYWQARCGECRGAGGMCATWEYAVYEWNDVSLTLYPWQTTRWPGSKMCNVRGSRARAEMLQKANRRMEVVV
jgi:hypothetical protein